MHPSLCSNQLLRMMNCQKWQQNLFVTRYTPNCIYPQAFVFCNLEALASYH